jgi:hypothetical protein
MKKDPYFKFLAVTLLFGVLLAFGSLSTQSGNKARLEKPVKHGQLAVIMRS